MARVYYGKINLMKESYLVFVKIRITCNGIAFVAPHEAQSMIACRRKADKVECIRAYCKLLSCHFVYEDVIRGLLQTRCAKDIPKTIDDPLYARWSIDM